MKMETLSSALAVLTAMITPAVLISACGTLILSTSTRLGRVVDRVRGLSERFEELARSEEREAMLEERRSMIFDQLDKLTSRARLLQRSMTVFYVALGIFVATSFSIGVFAVTGGTDYSWVPVILALSGASCLFYGSILLIFEARLALSALHAEMDFLWKLGQYYAPAKLREQSREQNLLARIPFIKSGERGESDR
jgi:ABC-type multidrug transport system fused ATPase/permease subunit